MPTTAAARLRALPRPFARPAEQIDALPSPRPRKEPRPAPQAGDLHPLVKMVGGKRRLAPAILERLPAFKGTYWEPFVGGGAIFCALHAADRLKGHVVLSDVNADLMALYKAVQEQPQPLIDGLKYLATRYQKRDPQELYYEQRGLWNEGLRDPMRFVFLKQTAFNGLWRVNSKGQMNSSWGKYKNPAILDEACIWAWHRALAHVELRTGSFKETCTPQQGDLVFADPPYVGTFDWYDASRFDEATHICLLSTLKAWRDAGAFIACSNSQAAGSLLDEHWPDGKRHELETSYTVNCRGHGRGLLKELLVTS